MTQTFGPQAPTIPSPQLPSGSQTPDAPGVDCETAMLFRAWLGPLFDQAASWSALMDTLRTKGYGLAIREGRLVLTDHASGARLCTVRFLGTSLRELAGRMGRPHVRALPGRPSCGELRLPLA